MLRTELCPLLDIDIPIIQAPIVPGACPELVAAVSDAGAIGSLGAAFRSADELRSDISRVRQLTRRPFIVNHVVPLVDEAAFAASLEAQPTAISLALGHRPDLIKRVHEAGLRVLHQVHTVTQARRVAESEVDVIIAQGSEAGGNCAMVASSVLVPQVVDAVSPIPVLAAGGVADGRGLAAALVLGAVGANIGTRFLASEEACVDPAWKQRILGAQSEDAVQLSFWQELFGAPGAEAFDVVPRALRTPFSDEWLGREVGGDAERLKAEIVKAVRSGRIHELAPFTGQATGIITSVSPARDIVDAIVTQAEDILRRASHLIV